MEIYTICNQKGGVSKSSNALELAYMLSQEKKTLLIDMDSQRNVSIYAGANVNHKGIYELLNAECTVQEAIQTVTYRDGTDLDVMVSNKNMANASKEFGDPEDIYLLSDLVEYLNYDAIVLDQAPARSPLLYMSYVASTDFIITSECDKGSLEGIQEIYTDISRFKKRKICKGEILGILLNKYENTTMHKQAYERLKKLGEQLDIPVFETKIRKSIAMSECKELAEPLNVYARYNNVAVDYRAFYKELKEKQEEKNTRKYMKIMEEI